MELGATETKINALAMFSEEDFSRFPCLSEKEAEQRIKAIGFNELPSAKRRNIFSLAWEVMREPMFILLLVGGGIYLVLGDSRDAFLLLASIFVIIGITFFQERKTERALEALRDLSSPRALVIRDGALKRVAGRLVARGDIILLSEGDRVPADAVILQTTNLSCNESLLTGESAMVRKIIWDGILSPSRPGGDDLPFVYSGTLVVQGRGVAQVLATGPATEMGKIGRSLEGVVQEKTLLQKDISSIVKKFALLGLVLCAAVVLAYGFFQTGENRWLGGLLAGIALAMSLIPEEFPVILTVFFALGAWRMSKKYVLTRRVSVIETLGATTVLCVDKTGTLTLNQMQVKKLYAKGEYFSFTASTGAAALPESYHELLEFGVLASHKDNFDPVEKAIRQTALQIIDNASHLHNDWTLVREYPLSSHLLAMSQVWISPSQKDFIIATKGAPEAIMELCKMDSRQVRANLAVVDQLAADGLKILGVAKAVSVGKALPKDQHAIKFKFVGLLGFEDPVRPGVPEAITECYGAGVRVMMITGDYPITAKKIAREINLKPTDNILTGEELDKMSDAALKKKIGNVSIFARVVPEQKLRIVNALKARGDIVAMTGDGVNDAPALKAANAGVAMGQRGTDVAREAADLVLLDDNFLSIVDAVKEGRRIFDNLTKAMAYIFAIHIPIAGMVLIPILLRWPAVLMPVHIVFLEMFTDPVCSIAFEAEGAEVNIMKRKPRNLKLPMFHKRVALLGLLQGFSMLLLSLVIYGLALNFGVSEQAARATAFLSMIASNIALVISNRSWSNSVIFTMQKRNTPLWLIVGGVVVLLILIMMLPPMREMFRFGEPSINMFVLALTAGLLSIAWFEGLKIWSRETK